MSPFLQIFDLLNDYERVKKTHIFEREKLKKRHSKKIKIYIRRRIKVATTCYQFYRYKGQKLKNRHKVGYPGWLPTQLPSTMSLRTMTRIIGITTTHWRTTGNRMTSNCWTRNTSRRYTIEADRENSTRRLLPSNITATALMVWEDRYPTNHLILTNLVQRAALLPPQLIH